VTDRAGVRLPERGAVQDDPARPHL
jgi:hypothetical protein